MRQKKAKITRELYFAKTLIDSKSPPANNQGLVRAGGEGSPGWKQAQKNQDTKVAEVANFRGRSVSLPNACELGYA